MKNFCWLAPLLRRIAGFALSIGLAGPSLALPPKSAEGVPEGTIGWFYYIRTVPTAEMGYAASAEEACALSALNHFDSPLYGMNRYPSPEPFYGCVYKGIFGAIREYTPTHLECKQGFEPRWPGICVRTAEVPQEPSCSTPKNTGAAAVEGNPVFISSGAKFQLETDVPSGGYGAPVIERTYRTMRQTGAAQSAGAAWSFSFDREFTVATASGGRPSKIKGSTGNGAYFEFSWKSSGSYVSTFNPREKLQSVNGKFDDWILTTARGDLERFKKIGGVFRLVSTHTKTGEAQFFTYDQGGKLESISGANGRSVNVVWEGGTVKEIRHPDGAVANKYEASAATGGLKVPGTERLIAVTQYDGQDRELGTKRYHYEDPYNRYLLTGITDQKGVRFAHYRYNGSGQAVLSEHAGGAQRYSFEYPDASRRVVTDPLGTKHDISLVYPRGAQAPGRVAKTTQPAGAGCGPGASDTTYDTLGRVTSETDFNEKKTLLCQ